MEKLVNKFEEIVIDHWNEGQEVDAEEIAPVLAGEAKRIALEFAKRMFRTKIMTQRKGYEEGIDTTPKEFDIVLGELTMDGEKLFDKFLEEYK